MAMLLAFVLFGALITSVVVPVPVVFVLLLVLLVIFVIRPLSIWLVLSLRRSTLSRSAKTFIAWFWPRGLNSLLFATLLILNDVPAAEEKFAFTGLVVAVSVIVHGASATPLSAWYGRRLEAQTMGEERESTATGLFRGASSDRISIETLAGRLKSNAPPLIVGVRSRSEYERDPQAVPGSQRVQPSDVLEWSANLSKGTQIVLFCTWPNEETSARAARELQARGFDALALAGGLSMANITFKIRARTLTEDCFDYFS